MWNLASRQHARRQPVRGAPYRGVSVPSKGRGCGGGDGGAVGLFMHNRQQLDSRQQTADSTLLMQGSITASHWALPTAPSAKNRQHTAHGRQQRAANNREHEQTANSRCRVEPSLCRAQSHLATGRCSPHCRKRTYSTQQTPDSR
jgi:hypothetical protein